MLKDQGFVPKEKEEGAGGQRRLGALLMAAWRPFLMAALRTWSSVRRSSVSQVPFFLPVLWRGSNGHFYEDGFLVLAPILARQKMEAPAAN